jgi:hypothetical protein
MIRLLLAATQRDPAFTGLQMSLSGNVARRCGVTGTQCSIRPDSQSLIAGV